MEIYINPKTVGEFCKNIKHRGGGGGGGGGGGTLAYCYFSTRRHLTYIEYECCFFIIFFPMVL